MINNNSNNYNDITIDNTHNDNDNNLDNNNNSNNNNNNNNNNYNNNGALRLACKHFWAISMESYSFIVLVCLPMSILTSKETIIASIDLLGLLRKS